MPRRKIFFPAALLVLLAAPLAAEHDLYLCASNAKAAVIAWPNAGATGLFRRPPAGAPEHVGLNHPLTYAFAADPADPRLLYLAALNGLLRSTDAGVTWRIVTDHTLTEPRAVATDPGAPGHVYLGLPDGLAVSHDSGTTWERRPVAPRRAFTKSLRVDRTRPGRVLAGTELGLYLTDDGARTWRRVLATTAATNDLRQSPHDPRDWFAVTQRDGAFRSRDAGLTWARVPGLPAGASLYNIDYDPTTRGRLVVCGWELGLAVSTDDGATWAARDAGLPSKKVWRVAFDPDRPGRLYASVHEEALFTSEDAGATWLRGAFDGSVINDFVFVEKKYPPAPPTLPPPTPRPVAAAFQLPADHRAAYLARAEKIVAFRAALESHPTLEFAPYGRIAAKLGLRQDAAWCSEKLLELLAQPVTGDMFWMFPVTSIAYLGRDQLTPAARAALRDRWRTYMPLRGDTENHWVLYYTTFYLMTELYPDDPGSTWFNGKSSAENRAEAQAWLTDWMRITTTIGQGEYDSPHYLTEYAVAMIYLASWARDPALRQGGHLMLDWIFADFAIDTLHGVYVGAHARVDDIGAIAKWDNLCTAYSWLLFDACPPTPYGWSLYFALLAKNYEVPEVLRRIATDRSTPYVERELKRTRHRWRHSDIRNAPVYKQTYMTPAYAVGSDQGGLLQPIQQHSWEVSWSLPDPRGSRATLFSMQPHSSAFELQTYFSELPDHHVAAVVRSKKSYDSPDKFLGGSPYEQVFQDLDTVVALYDIAPGARFPHVNGFLSKDLVDFSIDPSGWLFARGGGALLAYRPLAPYEILPVSVIGPATRTTTGNRKDWGGEPVFAATEAALTADQGDRRLYSPHLKNGTIVQAAAATEFKSFDDFKAAIRALPLAFSLAPIPTVTFTTLRGKKIAVAYGAAPKLDGRVVDYAREWKLFDSPYLHSEVGSRVLTLTHGSLQRVLDFNTLTITDSVTP